MFTFSQDEDRAALGLLIKQLLSNVLGDAYFDNFNVRNITPHLLIALSRMEPILRMFRDVAHPPFLVETPTINYVMVTSSGNRVMELSCNNMKGVNIKFDLFNPELQNIGLVLPRISKRNIEVIPRKVDEAWNILKKYFSGGAAGEIRKYLDFMKRVIELFKEHVLNWAPESKLTVISNILSCSGGVRSVPEGEEILRKLKFDVYTCPEKVRISVPFLDEVVEYVLNQIAELGWRGVAQAYYEPDSVVVNVVFPREVAKVVIEVPTLPEKSPTVNVMLGKLFTMVKDVASREPFGSAWVWVDQPTLLAGGVLGSKWRLLLDTLKSVGVIREV